MFAPRQRWGLCRRPQGTRTRRRADTGWRGRRRAAREGGEHHRIFRVRRSGRLKSPDSPGWGEGRRRRVLLLQSGGNAFFLGTSYRLIFHGGSESKNSSENDVSLDPMYIQIC